MKKYFRYPNSWMSLAIMLILVGCAQKVLVVGGMDDNGNFLKNAEIYDPNSQTFSLVSHTMSTGRLATTATTLADNSVLVAGGQSPAANVSAEIFQPSNHTFTLTNNMNHFHVSHTATLLDSAIVRGSLANYVLIAGGDQFSRVGTAEIYNPTAKAFINTGNMNTPRSQHTAILISHCNCVHDGKVLIVGGYDNNSRVLQSAEIYNPATQKFTKTGDMHTPRFRHTATLLNDGTVLITGGASQFQAKDNINPALNTAEIFDPKTGKFTQTKNLMTAHREAHAASLLKDGTVLLTGGQDEHFLIENTAEIYNPATGTFTSTSFSCAGAPPPKGCMMVGRDFHISKTLADGSVLIAGGVDSSFRTVASAEIYTPATQTFTPTGSMHTPRSGAAASLFTPPGL